MPMQFIKLEGGVCLSAFEERNKVYSMLQAKGIDPSWFVVGAGKTYTQKKALFEFDARNRKEIQDQTAVYAIKYYESCGIYLVWHIVQWSKWRNVRRGKFSAKYSDVMTAIAQKSSVQKGVEYRWRGQETVKVLTYEELEEFIEQISCNNEFELFIADVTRQPEQEVKDEGEKE